MKKTYILQRTVVLTSVALILAGCATTQGGMGGQATNQADEDPCSLGQTALAGAAAGALLGALLGGKNGAMKGAVLAGAVGAAACLAINVQSRQSKTAAQADRDYKQARGALPRDPVVVSYSPQLSVPSVQRGQPFKVNSVVELVNGTVQPVREVREELLVFNPDGTQINNSDKPFSANSGGRFENSFNLKLPPGVSQGTYALKTNLYVNNKLAATRDLQTQVVWDGRNAVLLASR